jgi:hypothetical protein
MYKGTRKSKGFADVTDDENARKCKKGSTLTNARKVAEASCCLEHDTVAERGQRTE